MIFYDELVFASRELCPMDMLNLPYVKFLEDVKESNEKFDRALSLAKSKYQIHDERNSNFGDPFEHYSDVLCRMTGQPSRVNADTAKFLPDNHSHTVSISKDYPVSGSSTWFQNVLADWLISEEFNLGDADIVSNTASSVFYNPISMEGKEVSKSDLSSSITHELTVRRIPNYLDSSGPYHECLEELRNHQFLENYRKYIDELINENNQAEIIELSDEVTKLAYKTRNEVFNRFLKKKNEYWVATKASAAEVAGSIIPGVGLVSKLISEREEEKEREKLRWAGFVTDLSEFPNKR